jgi:hypothetical protein
MSSSHSLLTSISFLAVLYMTASCAPTPPIGGNGYSCSDWSNSELHEPIELVNRYDTGMRNATNTVIATPDEWLAYWRRICKGCEDLPPGAVDFSRQMLLLSALGDSAPAHGLKIDSPRVVGHHLEVTVRQEIPASNCVITMARYQPVIVVQVQKSSCPVVFRTVRAVHICAADSR